MRGGKKEGSRSYAVRSASSGPRSSRHPSLARPDYNPRSTRVLETLTDPSRGFYGDQQRAQRIDKRCNLRSLPGTTPIRKTPRYMTFFSAHPHPFPKIGQHSLFFYISICLPPWIQSFNGNHWSPFTQASPLEHSCGGRKPAAVITHAKLTTLTGYCHRKAHHTLIHQKHCLPPTQGQPVVTTHGDPSSNLTQA